MTNVLFIHQSAELYGSDKMLLMLLSQIDRAAFTPVVILPDAGPLKTELEKLSIKVVVAPVLKVYRDMFRPGNMVGFLRDTRKGLSIVNKLHKHHAFDVVYSNTLAVMLGMIFARRKKIKHVWHVHEIIVHPNFIAKAYPVLLSRYADRIICNSEATKDNLVKRINSLEKKCTVVYNGLDIPPLAREAKGALPVQFLPEDIVITLVGRISRLKGHKWLLDTYYNYLSGTKARLLFVGSPVPGQEHYLKEVETIIEELGSSDRITILPFTKDLDPVWQATDIAVMPSTEAESFGLVALEAMIAQKPIVASALGGLLEIVVDNKTGYLIEPGNSEKLAEAIANLMNDISLREALGKNGRERAIAEFSLKNYVARISEILCDKCIV